MAAVLLAVTLIAGCGKDPALRPETLRVRTVAVDPAPRQLAAPARERAIARWRAVLRWQSVAAWSWVTTAHFAAAVDRARVTSSDIERSTWNAIRPGRSDINRHTNGGAWGALAQCESSGNWSETKGSFEGGLQFSNATWLAYGGGRYAQHAYDATPGEQIAVAERVLAAAGWGSWPACSRKLGLLP